MTGMADAACASIPQEIVDQVFFSTDTRDRMYAKRVCEGCPVREACLRMALDAERGAGLYERYGIFGGTTPVERFRMQKESAV